METVSEDVSEVCKVELSSTLTKAFLDYSVKQGLKGPILEQQNSSLIAFILSYQVKAFNMLEFCSDGLRPMLRFSHD